MTEFYFSVNIDNDRTLCIAPLTDRTIEKSGQEIDDVSGYFLFERCSSDQFGGVEIIARLCSEEAALRLRDMLRMT